MEETIIKKTSSMYSARDLTKMFIGRNSKFQRILKELFEKKEEFLENGQKKPLVIEASSGNRRIFVLNEGGLSSFAEKYCLPEKKEGMYSAAELAKIFVGTVGKLTECLKDDFQEKVTFTDEKGQKKPLIIQVQSGRNTPLVLNEGGLVFFQSHHLLTKIEKGFANPYEYYEQIRNGIEFYNILHDSYLRNETFLMNGQLCPFVELNEGVFPYNYRLNPHGKDIFLAEKGFLMKTEEMSSAQELTSYFTEEYKKFLNYLKKSYEQGDTFIHEGKRYPLVIQVRSGRNRPLVLHEKGLTAFIEKYIPLPTKTDEMLSSCDLSYLYGRSTGEWAENLEKMAKINLLFSHKGSVAPLVIRVVSGSQTPLVINEGGAAYLEKFLGIAPKRQWGAEIFLGQKADRITSQCFREKTGFFGKVIQSVNGQ